MNADTGALGADAIRPIVHAKAKTESVQEDLAIAGAELDLTNTALERSLPERSKQGDVRKALDQNEVVQQKVTEAAGELAEVTELLQEEIAERHRLEAELARRPPPAAHAS